MSEEETNFMMTEGLFAVKSCLNIASDYTVWQEQYKNMSIEICELYNKNGVACICAGDEKRIMYMKDEE